jgi:cephalosporin hydroxylase
MVNRSAGRFVSVEDWVVDEEEQAVQSWEVAANPPVASNPLTI